MSLKLKNKSKLAFFLLITIATLATAVIATQQRTSTTPKAAYLRPNLAKLSIPTPTSYICKPNTNPPCPAGFVCMSGICKKPSSPSPTPTPTPIVQSTPRLTINTEYIPSLWEKTNYSYSIQASTNRIGTLTMKISDLPSGLTTGQCTNNHILPSSVSGNKITASYITCKITGTPLVSGTSHFTVDVSDDIGNTTTKKISITIRKKSILTNFFSFFKLN